jgi:TRAP-type C4-dicarboxylate transport system permease small subunit
MSSNDDTALQFAYRVYLRGMDALAASSMFLIVVIMIVQVFYRYVLNDSLIWAEEICRYILVWQTFLLVGYAYQRGDLIALDFLPRMISPRQWLVVRTIVAIPVVVFLALMVWYGFSYASHFTKQTIPALDFIWMSLTGHSLGLSIWVVYISVPIGSAVLALHVVITTIYHWIAGPEQMPAPGIHATGE